MNFLRSAPFKVFAFASALQVFIFSCWDESAAGAPAGAASPGFFDRHSFMKLLRSLPFNSLALASALQVFIFSCWAVSAKLLPAVRARAAATRMVSFFMAYSSSVVIGVACIRKDRDSQSDRSPAEF